MRQSPIEKLMLDFQIRLRRTQPGYKQVRSSQARHAPSTAGHNTDVQLVVCGCDTVYYR